MLLPPSIYILTIILSLKLEVLQTQTSIVTFLFLQRFEFWSTSDVSVRKIY